LVTPSERRISFVHELAFPGRRLAGYSCGRSLRAAGFARTRLFRRSAMFELPSRFSVENGDGPDRSFAAMLELARRKGRFANGKH